MKCVYKISCLNKEITEFYIGSSVNFDKRKECHKSHSKNLSNKNYCYPLYMFINVNGGIENWEMIVLEEFPNHTKKELYIEEQKYMGLLKPTLNSQNANGCDIERKKKYDKKYNKIRNKIKANCDICGIEMLKTNLYRHIKTQHPII